MWLPFTFQPGVKLRSTHTRTRPSEFSTHGLHTRVGQHRRHPTQKHTANQPSTAIHASKQTGRAAHACMADSTHSSAQFHAPDNSIRRTDLRSKRRRRMKEGEERRRLGGVLVLGQSSWEVECNGFLPVLTKGDGTHTAHRGGKHPEGAGAIQASPRSSSRPQHKQGTTQA